MTITLTNEVSYILDTLEKSGFEAYVVGGCVRDALMGQVPKDWDICTSALPEQIIDIFDSRRTGIKGQHVIETGIKHGTVTLVLSSAPFEITTYRTDGKYTDSRHPDCVTFVKNLPDDLSRRDFTINAMAYNPKCGLTDLYGGAEDIKNKIIRCVGDADKRFEEDALRILRALRFASRLSFQIDEDTSKSIVKNKELMRSIASERITVELGGLLTGNGAGSIIREYSDIIRIIIPEIADMFGFVQNNPHHHLDVWQHTIAAVENAPQDVYLRLTMLLHDIAKPTCYTEENGIGHFYEHATVGADMTRTILRRLKYDNETVKTVCDLVFYHNTQIEPRAKIVRRWLNRIGEQRLGQLIEVKRADCKAQSEAYRYDKLRELDETVQIMNTIIEQQQCFSLKDLAVNGSDLISIGITDGVVIGKMLRFLLEEVINETVENDKDLLLKSASDNERRNFS